MDYIELRRILRKVAHALYIAVSTAIIMTIVLYYLHVQVNGLAYYDEAQETNTVMYTEVVTTANYSEETTNAVETETNTLNTTAEINNLDDLIIDDEALVRAEYLKCFDNALVDLDTDSIEDHINEKRRKKREEIEAAKRAEEERIRREKEKAEEEARKKREAEEAAKKKKEEENNKKGMEYIGTYRVTGYDSCAYCNGQDSGLTASGTYITPGRTIAMLTLPLGSKVYIEGIGYRVVEDTGNFPRNTIDLAVNNHQEAYDITGYYKVYLVS